MRWWHYLLVISVWAPRWWIAIIFRRSDRLNTSNTNNWTLLWISAQYLRCPINGNGKWQWYRRINGIWFPEYIWIPFLIKNYILIDFIGDQRMKSGIRMLVYTFHGFFNFLKFGKFTRIFFGILFYFVVIWLFNVKPFCVKF